MEEISNCYDRRGGGIETRSHERLKLMGGSAAVFADAEHSDCRCGRYFSHKIFTLEALRNARLCPSIHLESRPATLVLADTVF